MPVEIRLDAPQLAEIIDRLREVPGAMERAMTPAVKDFTAKFKREVQGYLAENSPLPKELTAKATRARGPKAVPGGALASVNVASRRQPLIEFDVQPMRQTATKGQRPSQWEQFTYSIFPGERRAAADNIEGASIPFVANVKGDLQVYYRPGKNRRKITKSFGPSVQFYVSSPEAESVFNDFANANFPEILQRYAEIALGV